MRSAPPAPIWFVVQRHHGLEFPAIFRDYLPPNLTRKLPVDDKRKPIEQPPTSYMLRLDRNDPGNWLKRPLAEAFGEFLAWREIGALPPPNLADPPRKHETRIGFGERYVAPTPPGYGLPPTPFPEPGTLQRRPNAGAYIPDDWKEPGDDL